MSDHILCLILPCTLSAILLSFHVTRANSYPKQRSDKEDIGRRYDHEDSFNLNVTEQKNGRSKRIEQTGETEE